MPETDLSYFREAQNESFTWKVSPDFAYTYPEKKRKKKERKKKKKPAGDHRTRTHKRLRRTVFTMSKHNIRFLGVSPFFKLQNDIETTVDGEKN